MNFNVVTIVVTYNSDIDRLKKSLFALSSQCRVVIVDNSTQDSSRVKIREVCTQAGAAFLPLYDNFGIARAQNVGIDWACKHAAVDILLMDDDSVPSESLVTDLLNARMMSRSHCVVVSARTISESGEDISNRLAKSSDGLTSCTELTSSGTLIPIEVFDLVGAFDDNLFIDCVDFEWGWRAHALGVPLFLCDGVAIQHRLGQGSRFGLRIPNPIRHYYQYRNVLRMIFNSKAPLRWRFSQFFKLPVKLVLIALVADHRSDRLRYVGFGICDFISGRFGKFNH